MKTAPFSILCVCVCVCVLMSSRLQSSINPPTKGLQTCCSGCCPALVSLNLTNTNPPLPRPPTAFPKSFNSAGQTREDSKAGSSAVVCILRFVDCLLRATRHKNIHSLEASPVLEAGSGSCGQGPEDSLSWLYINYQLWCTDYYLFIKYYSPLHVSSLKCSSWYTWYIY